MVQSLVKGALVEDLNKEGDITSRALIPATRTAEASISNRKAGVLCGLDFALAAFAQVDSTLDLTPHKKDGDTLAVNDKILTIKGNARAIMEGERTAINFIGHLSGIASATAHLAALIKHTSAKLYDTRKTTPNLRVVEKYAVHCGGGNNHRIGLYDGILIKDNHIAVVGGVQQALDAVRDIGKNMVVEIEVDTLSQLDTAIAAGTDVVLLDNMPPDILRQAIARIKEAGANITTEASGGINAASIVAIAESGVDYVSVGSITHSAPTLDVGLDISIN
ncbi:MAG: carboxylating nicotinate-nucleotide diphosphorylase [Alphaproteobacteria bacterium]|nr:carboxylating nicotinate-nucleotide diphosphorylase [Alphaproteobacteria bacterium]MBE8220003.1 carboxylating nicotinate-nucleotide diphosphorylase [Alphaproteobacteria bacterium]